MSRGVLWWIGFVIGVTLGAIYRLLTCHRRTVVEYDAVDHEHGPVHVEVTSNRLTGRRTRRLYKRDP